MCVGFSGRRVCFRSVYASSERVGGEKSSGSGVTGSSISFLSEDDIERDVRCHASTCGIAVFSVLGKFAGRDSRQYAKLRIPMSMLRSLMGEILSLLVVLLLLRET